MTLATYSITPHVVVFVGKAGTIFVDELDPRFRDVIDALLLGVDPTDLVEDEDDDGEIVKRYRVVLRALGPGLSGYVTKIFDTLGDESAENAADVAVKLWDRPDAEAVSVTEL